MFDHNNVDRLVTENLKKDVMRKPIKIDSSQPRCIHRKGCSPFNNDFEAPAKLCIEFNGDL